MKPRLALHILLSILSTKNTNALVSNPERSPQILNDTTDVCIAPGRTEACEVELDVPAACIAVDDNGASSSSCPIVFFFHGAGGSNNGFARSGVHAASMIGVYPQGENGWNTGPKSSNLCAWDDYECTSDPDEGAFVASIISQLRLAGADGRIYLVGNSNGAALAHRLASNAGADDLPIGGIVTKVTQLLESPLRSGPGVLNYNQPRSGGRAVSVLNLMGMDDGLIPYEGGGSSVFDGEESFQLMSALESMAVWAVHNGCGLESPVVTEGISYTNNNDPSRDATFYEYGGCPQGIIVEHYALHGAGHSFGAGAALDGVDIDHDIAFQFINRVEALGGGGGETSSPTDSPPKSAGPTAAPAQGIVCEDDPDWRGKFNDNHTCTFIGVNSAQRCVWESSDGTKASEACKVVCDTCPTPSPITTASSSPTDSFVTTSPTNRPTKPPTMKPIIGPTGSPVTPNPATAPMTASPVSGPIEFTAEWTSSYADGAETLIFRDISSIMNYQPPMPMPDDALDLPTACPHHEAGLVHWNDPDISWPLSGFGPPPADGSAITIPADTSIIIRARQLTSSSESPYGRITIPSGSRLIFDDSGVEEDGSTTNLIEMHTLGITVEGALEAGSPTCRIEGGIQLTLHGEYGNPGSASDRHLSDAAASDMGLKGILVKDIPGARMDIHGKLYHPTWTRLAAPVPGTEIPSAPSVRNSEIFLQDCVNWPDYGKIIVTTSHVKDTRGYHFNEEATIASGGVQCVTIFGKQYGKIVLTSPLEYYHHAGEKEYQCEVGLLTRSILIQGNDRSDPIDDFPLECDATENGWTKMPCPNTFLTGFGGHTIVVGQAKGRLRGVEFHRMGMTNILGRYPVHFHHHTVEAGKVSVVTDCAVWRSYYRAITLHDAFHLKVQRNTAFDISGHAYYLESGVEENNRVEYNLAAFVHVIDGAQIMPSNTVENKLQSDTILVPADHTASGFYISNVHNYVVGNAASGGWSGIQFPVLPEPVDKTLRFNGVVPKDRPSLLITGNSIHSSSWFAQNSGAMYEGGSLYWATSDTESETLIYNAGRVSSARLTRYTKDEDGNDDWFRVYNTTVWLANIGATGWGKRAEINGLEVSDFQNRAVFVLFTVWLNSIVINCRTSNAPKVPDPGNGLYENRLNNGRSWSGFFTYDHLMNHILTNWRVSNCGGVARGLEPWVQGGGADTGNAGLVTIPVNGLAPEVQLISKGMQFDWPTVGGENFVNESIFFAGSGADNFHSMQYQSNWEDADGSWTNRKVGTDTSTVMGPARAGAWWHLDFRPGKCEVRDSWKLPHQLCDKDTRKLASMFTVVMPQSGQQGSAVLAMLDPNANKRKTRAGSMTHFGLLGDGSLNACTPPETCGNTTSRSWDPDLTGPFNHAKYGGWYLSFDEGTPVHLSIMKIQLEEGTTMIQAMSLPTGTPASDVNIWAESYSRTYNFALVSSLDEVRNAANGDKYFLNESTNTLYWRVIAGYVDDDLSFGWIDRDSLSSFSREGLTITDTTTKNQIQIHIEISCSTESTGAFCALKPEFDVPDMGCPDGEVMVAIDQCGLPCTLLDEGCTTPSMVPSLKPSQSPSDSSSTLLSLKPSSFPTPTCIPCSDDPTPWMNTMGYKCDTAPNWLINIKCNLNSFWVNNNHCEMRCQATGKGYHDTSCCPSPI